MRSQCSFLLAGAMLGGLLGTGCSGNKGGGFDDPLSAGSSDAAVAQEAGADDSGFALGPGDAAPLMLGNDAQASSGASPCTGGNYVGTFAGSYSSNLIVGIPLTVTGNVDMTLNQAGSNETTCTFAGETESCANFYKVEGGTVTGVANSTMLGDASFGGYPYFCALTGTLDCKMKELVGGWLQCTYCVTQLADGGMMCAPLIGGLGGGIGGQFAGPVSATYDTDTHAFVGGTWNGAEALAGNDGGSPGPDGGSISSYLALDGGYGIGKYGGSGTWNATHQ
jgi:hypothetical protein